MLMYVYQCSYSSEGAAATYLSSEQLPQAIFHLINTEKGRKSLVLMKTFIGSDVLVEIPRNHLETCDWLHSTF